jgi:hypothetical protein
MHPLMVAVDQTAAHLFEETRPDDDLSVRFL